MVASVRLANGGTVDAVNMSDGSRSSPSLAEREQSSKHIATAVHVTMDDPILRKKIMLKHQHQAPQPSPKTKRPGPDASASPAAAGKIPSYKPTKSDIVLKQKISAMQQQSTLQGGSNSNDSFSNAKSRSGSDEGYAALSKHQSGSSGSGSDSILSNSAKKKDNVASSGHGSNGERRAVQGQGRWGIGHG